MKVFELTKNTKATDTNQQPNPSKSEVGFELVDVRGVFLIDIIYIFVNNIINIFMRVWTVALGGWWCG